jgi:hypothetical protein
MSFIAESRPLKQGLRYGGLLLSITPLMTTSKLAIDDKRLTITGGVTDTAVPVSVQGTRLSCYTARRYSLICCISFFYPCEQRY